MKAIKNAFTWGRQRKRDKQRGKGSPTSTNPEDMTPTAINQHNNSLMGDAKDSNVVTMGSEYSNEGVSKRMVIYNNPEEVGCIT